VHTQSKQAYQRTNKNDVVEQLAAIEHRTRTLRTQAPDQQLPHEHLVDCRPDDPYQISRSRDRASDFRQFLHIHREDVATQASLCLFHDYSIFTLLQHFYRQLTHFLLVTITGQDREFTASEQRSLLIKDNRLYEHQILRINFTSYDIRRDQDSINVGTNSDIMVLAQDKDNGHPYWYARIIKIYHAMICRTGCGNTWEKRDFLWVRWYGLDTSRRFGFKTRRLPSVGFLDPSHDDEAFGFIDPAAVIRAVHLIPAFHYGLTSDILPPSIARRDEEEDSDYKRYYVMM
jgi:hypothetical protein